MANISGDWNRNMPSGSSSIADGDDLLRQHWTSLQSLIESEHYMTDSLTSAGLHKLGSARGYADVSSRKSVTNVPAGTRDGRLFLELDTGRIHALGPSQITAFTQGYGAFDVYDSVLASGADVPAVFEGEYLDIAPNSEQWISGSGTTLTVPSGCSGYYQFVATLNFGQTGAPYYFWSGEGLTMRIKKNGINIGGANVTYSSGLSGQQLFLIGSDAWKSKDSISLHLETSANTSTNVAIRFMGHKVG